MAEMMMTVNGVSTVLGNLDKVGKGLPAQIKKVIRQDAKEAFEQSQNECPVGIDVFVGKYRNGHYIGDIHVHEAGTLKGSGKLTYPDYGYDFTAEISYGGHSSTGDECDYPWYVEEGTYKMAAQPFLYPNFLYGCRLLQIDLQNIVALSNLP